MTRRNINIMVVLIIVILLSLFIYLELDKLKWTTKDGQLFTKEDLFGVQIANDPLFTSIIVDMRNLTYQEMRDFNFIDENNEINKDMEFWASMIWHHGEGREICEPTYKQTKATIFVRWMVYL